MKSLPVPASLTSPKYRVTKKTFLLPLIGLAAFFIYIYIFNVDILQIIAKVRQIDLGSYVLAAAAVVLDTLFFTLTWNSLLRFLSVKVSAAKLYLFVWVGVFIDTMIPAESVSGEIAKIYLVNREQNGTAGKATASIVAQRLIGMGINLATLLIGATFLVYERQFYGTLFTLILFLVCLTVFFLALLLLLCFRENWTLRFMDALLRFVERVSRGRWKASYFRGELMEAAKSFHVAMKEYVHAPKTLAAAFFLSTVSWVLALLAFYFTFVSIGYPQISWSAILVISSIFAAVKSVPVGVPFEVGLPEITLTTLLILFGVPPEVSATATILMRLLTLWMRFFIGFAAQQWVGMRAIATNGNDKTLEDDVSNGVEHKNRVNP